MRTPLFAVMPLHCSPREAMPPWRGPSEAW
jgi:hypothetical protein